MLFMDSILSCARPYSMYVCNRPLSLRFNSDELKKLVTLLSYEVNTDMDRAFSSHILEEAMSLYVPKG
jgi:hypothetical protein